MFDPVIANADYEIAQALMRCAQGAQQTGLCTQELIVDKRSVLVAIKRVERVFHAMIRVDMVAAQAVGLGDERETDRWLGIQEQALNALVVPWKAAAPFVGMVLRHKTGSGQGDWVSHIATSKDNRYRLTQWTIS